MHVYGLEVYILSCTVYDMTFIYIFNILLPTNM